MKIFGLNVFTDKSLDDAVTKAVGNIYGVYPYETQSGLFNSGGNKTALLREYASWVYACVSVRAQAVASANYRVYKRLGSDNYEDLDDHNILLLLEKPNPLDTQYDLMFKTVCYMDLTGDAYWAIYRNGSGKITELWLLPSEDTTIHPNTDGTINRYEVKPTGTQKAITFRPDEVIHFKHPNPNNPFYGASIVSAAAQAVDVNNYQHNYQRTFYRRAAIPPAVLETENKVNKDTIEVLRKQFESVYSGSENAGKTLILENGLKYKTLGINPKDLDYLATNRFTLQEICSIFRVPPSMLGIIEDVNRANAESQEYTFAKVAIEPLLTAIDQRITIDLLRQFNDSRMLFVKHDSTVPENEERNARASQLRIQSGLTTINEERKLHGYDPIEYGDYNLVPVNYMPLDQMVEREVTQEGKPIQENQETASDAPSITEVDS
jgi:HK97 family phage portal protein